MNKQLYKNISLEENVILLVTKQRLTLVVYHHCHGLMFLKRCCEALLGEFFIPYCQK